MTDDASSRDRPEGTDIGDSPTVSPSAVPTAGLGSGAAPPLPDRIGRYQILGVLGEGGMGVVYEAEQPHPKRRVALKVIRGGAFVNDARLRLFEREAETLARLKHPSIAAIHESGRTEDGQHFFVMELVRGVTLGSYLRGRPEAITPPELRHRLALFQQIADAVHYAHLRGVIHRDLKPGNVIVTEEPTSTGTRASATGLPSVKVLDFGLARITDGDVAATMTTEIGVIKGTLPYMSPEQARGRPEEIDARTDVYALGVVLYEMLTGSLPYDVESGGVVQALRVICEEAPQPLSQTWSGAKRLDPDVETIIGKALEKEADRRYQSAAALSEDIDRYLTSRPIEARPPSTMYQLRKFARRNRVLVGGVLATIAVLVAGIVGTSVGMVRARSAQAAAQEEARRAEASHLVTLGSVELEPDRTRALAYALASLERADSPGGRRLALQALWRGPSAFILPSPLTNQVWGLDFSPDGRWLAGGHGQSRQGRIFLWPADGHTVTELPVSDTEENEWMKTVRFVPDSGLLFSMGMWEHTVKLWSVPEGQLIRSMNFAAPPHIGFQLGWFPPLLDAEAKRMVSVFRVPADSSLLFQLWAIDQDEPQLLDRREIEGVTLFKSWEAVAALDPTGNRLAYAKGAEIFLVDLAKSGRQEERLVGRHDDLLAKLTFHPDGETLATIDRQGEIRLWSLASGGGKPRGSMQSVESCMDLRFDRHGRHLAATSGAGIAHVWDLVAPPDADPMVLNQGTGGQMNAVAFHPAGDWIATSGDGHAAIWPLGRSYPRVLRGHTQGVSGITFGPQGDWVASASMDGTMRVWPLDPASAERHRVVYEGENLWAVGVSPDGENLLAIPSTDPVVVPVAGGKQRLLPGLEPRPGGEPAFGPHGRLVAVSGRGEIRVWDLDSDDVLVLDHSGEWTPTIAFTPDGALLSAGGSGDLRLWDLASGTFRVLRPAVEGFVLSRDGRRLLGVYKGKLSLHDLEDGSVRELVTHGNQISAAALHPDGVTVVTASGDGVIRVGPLDEEPHLLLGHEGAVGSLAVSPDGRWIASGGADTTVRLWPMPEGVPFHTLPHEELLDRLRALTNVRVVEDEQSGTGYSLDVSAFRGWETVPTW